MRTSHFGKGWLEKLNSKRIFQPLEKRWTEDPTSDLGILSFKNVFILVPYFQKRGRFRQHSYYALVKWTHFTIGT